MSAVLPYPTLPMLAIEERFKAMENRIVALEKENVQLKDELESTKMLLEASFGRTERLEKIIFDCDEDGEINRDDESGDPILNKIFTITNEKPVSESKTVVTPNIETTKDERTAAVVEYLKEEVKINDFGKFTIGMKELTTFLTTIIKPELRIKKVSRQMKADIFQRAVELFPGIVEITTSLSKNKTKYLTLKPSVKCQNTHGRIGRAPIGILA